MCAYEYDIPSSNDQMKSGVFEFDIDTSDIFRKIGNYELVSTRSFALPLRELSCFVVVGRVSLWLPNLCAASLISSMGYTVSNAVSCVG